MTNISHSAIGPALGYYYQAIFALICLFDSKNDNAYVSIETFDDVYHDDGSQKTLHQLKHSINTDSKISIKSDELWKTLKVWCDYIKTNDPNYGIFTLSTVATIDSKSPLNVLANTTGNRDFLESSLIQEAQRVIDERKAVAQENLIRISNKQKEAKLPYESKYKGCEAFISLDETKRNSLLKNTRINTESFSIKDAQNEVIQKIRTGSQSKNYITLAESIIAWWDREAVRSLTRERNECIFFSELQEFISKKNSEIYNDGFTNDIDDLELPPPDISHPIHIKQLEIIDATTTQTRRSFNTELKARIQRGIWMKNNLPAASKLKNYDNLLIERWSYEFDEIKDVITEDQKKEKGRSLLNWSDKEAHNQVKSISPHYNNPDLIRGSYQMLSKDKRVGWHCDFDSLIKLDNENE
jgi:hypothetical protein